MIRKQETEPFPHCTFISCRKLACLAKKEKTDEQVKMRKSGIFRSWQELGQIFCRKDVSQAVDMTIVTREIRSIAISTWIMGIFYCSSYINEEKVVGIGKQHTHVYCSKSKKRFSSSTSYHHDGYGSGHWYLSSFDIHA